MIRWQLKELTRKYTAKTGNDLPYRVITERTGLSKTTLSAISRGDAARIDLDTADKLLLLMSEMLGEKLTTQDLIKFEVEP